MITATDIAHDARHAEEMGIHADPAIDLAGMVGWKDDVVDQLTSGVEKLCKANQVNLMEGTATFVDEHTARISHGGEGQAPKLSSSNTRSSQPAPAPSRSPTSRSRIRPY